MKKAILLSGLIISIFIFHNCCTTKKACYWNYHFNKNDKLYIKSFRNHDSLSLKNIKDIQFVLSPDSLIVSENTITTKKFYKDYFEVYEEKLSSMLYIYINILIKAVLFLFFIILRMNYKLNTQMKTERCG